jgi:hypothetical protein
MLTATFDSLGPFRFIIELDGAVRILLSNVPPIGEIFL